MTRPFAPSGWLEALKGHLPFLLLFAVTLGFNLYGLTLFPRVGGDEGFLANFAYLFHRHGMPIVNPNLSNVGCHKGFVFFFPSGSLYFCSLALFGKLFGFGLFAMRSHALFFACLTLGLTYLMALLLWGSKMKGLLAALLLATSTHFMSLAHAVRQEMMLTAVITLILALFLRWRTDPGRRGALLAGAFLCSAAVSIHGNGVYAVFYFLGVLGWAHWHGSKISPRLWGELLIALAAGSLIFILFDYAPVRAEYWHTFHAPIFQGAHLAHYGRLFSHPLQEIGLSFMNIGIYFWSTRLHSWIIYPVLYGSALIGGFGLRSRENDFLIFTILWMLLVFLPAHSMIYYFAYSLPLYALLLGSVLGDLASTFAKNPLFGRSSLFPAGLGLLFLLMAVHPVAHVWLRRDYDWEAQVRRVKAHIDDHSRFIADGAFFFGLVPENLYDHHPLKCGYDLKTFMRENHIRAVIVNQDISGVIHAAGENALAGCRRTVVSAEFQTALGRKEAPPVEIYECSPF